MIDSHCHLTAPEFRDELPEILERARQAGVTRMVTIGTAADDWPAALALATAEPDVSVACGVHPHDAAGGGWEGLTALRGQIVAVGEIGLDYHYDFARREVQRDAFAAQVAIAHAMGLPIIIHEREAAEDVLAILDREGCPPGVWHCFSGGEDLAREVLARGLHLGFGGLVTFRKGTEGIRAAARECPGERLLLETDAPYLAPVPHRGHRNEPAFVAATAAFLAELRGELVDGAAATGLFDL